MLRRFLLSIGVLREGPSLLHGPKAVRLAVLAVLVTTVIGAPIVVLLNVVGLNFGGVVGPTIVSVLLFSVISRLRETRWFRRDHAE